MKIKPLLILCLVFIGFSIGFVTNSDAQVAMVKDIYPGVNWGAGGGHSVVNNKILFATDSKNDGVAGNELWKSDGSAPGTDSIKVIVPKTSNDYIDIGGVAGNTLFFYADSGYYAGLWKSDGTDTGTVFLKSLHVFPGSSSISSIYDMNGIAYFQVAETGSAALWRSDGTPSGTFMLKNFSNQGGILWFNKGMFTVMNNELYFFAVDYTTSTPTTSLWKTDGTAAGTVFIKYVVFGPGSYNPSGLFTYYYEKSNININGTLFFCASDAVHGSELWKSDGTAIGTVLVKDINPGVNGSNPEYLTNFNGTLYFKAETTNGIELWESDGTAAGTVLVKDINPGSGSAFVRKGGAGSFIYTLINNGNVLLFCANDGVHGDELWKSDGTAIGTQMVKDIQQGTNGAVPFDLLNVNGILYFGAGGFGGRELWKSDGTVNGTMRLTDIYPGSGSSLFDAGGELIDFRDTIYMRADDNIHGTELWKYSPCTLGNPYLTIKGDTTICTASNDTITIYSSQAGFVYQIYKNGSPIGNSQAGGGDIKLIIPVANLSVGTNIFDVQANNSGCITYMDHIIKITINGSVPSQPSTINTNAYNCTQVLSNYCITNVSGTTYSWSLSGGGTLTNLGDTAQITWITSGTYTITVTPSNSCGNGTARNKVIAVTASPATPTVTANGMTTFCQGGSVTLTASSSPNYAWIRNGASIPFASYQNYSVTQNGDYYVVVNGTNFCYATSAITTAIVNPLPTVTVSVVNASSCSASDGSISANISGGTAPYFYSWSNSKTTSAITGLTQSTYTLIIIDAQSCTSTSIATVSCPNDVANYDFQNVIIIFPNPFSSSTTLQTDKTFNDATLTIYNFHGQTIKQIDNLSGQTIMFHRDNLPSGLYFLRLTQDNKVTAGKLVITDN
jgi:ELWxxDGT repeat protein